MIVELGRGRAFDLEIAVLTVPEESDLDVLGREDAEVNPEVESRP